MSLTKFNKWRQVTKNSCKLTEHTTQANSRWNKKKEKENKSKADRLLRWDSCGFLFKKNVCADWKPMSVLRVSFYLFFSWVGRVIRIYSAPRYNISNFRWNDKFRNQKQLKLTRDKQRKNNLNKKTVFVCVFVCHLCGIFDIFCMQSNANERKENCHRSNRMYNATKWILNFACQRYSFPSYRISYLVSPTCVFYRSRALTIIQSHHFIGLLITHLQKFTEKSARCVSTVNNLNEPEKTTIEAKKKRFSHKQFNSTVLRRVHIEIKNQTKL